MKSTIEYKKNIRQITLVVSTLPISIHFEFQIIFELGTIAKKMTHIWKKKDTTTYILNFVAENVIFRNSIG